MRSVRNPQSGTRKPPEAAGTTEWGIFAYFCSGLFIIIEFVLNWKIRVNVRPGIHQFFYHPAIAREIIRKFKQCPQYFLHVRDIEFFALKAFHQHYQTQVFFKPKQWLKIGPVSLDYDT